MYPSRVGHVTLAAHPNILRGDSSTVSVLAWNSRRIRRVVRFSLGCRACSLLHLSVTHRHIPLTSSPSLFISGHLFQILIPSSPCLPCFFEWEFGDYEEDLPTTILGGADENVCDKRDLYGISCLWWLAGLRSTCDDTGTGACSSWSLSPSTYKLFEGRNDWWKFAEPSDRSTSLVHRVPVIAPNQRRTHQFTLPWRINSECTTFREGAHDRSRE